MTIETVVVALVAFAGSWGGVKIHLLYLQKSIEDHEKRIRALERG